MKHTLFTTVKGDRQFIALGVVSALVFVSILAAHAKAEQSTSVKIIQNGETVYDGDITSPEEFLSHYDDMFSDLHDPFDQIKELTNTPNEFKTVIESGNGSTTIERSTDPNTGATKTVVESNHSSSDNTPSGTPSPTVTNTPDGIEIDNGNGTTVKKNGDSTTIEGPNVRIRMEGGKIDDNSDNDVDVDIRRDNGDERSSFRYNSRFDD